MKLGVVIDGHTGFINELLEDWQTHYQTEVFNFREINLPLSKGRVNQWRLKRSLMEFIDRNDVVFFEWAGPLTILGSQLDGKTPLIVRLHSWELYEFADHIRWTGIARTILVSQAMREKFINLYPAQVSNSEVVNCGISLEKFKPAVREFNGVIGILADLIPIKRVYDLILTLYDLNQLGYDLRLIIGGKAVDGSNNKRYHISMLRAIEKLSLNERVSLHGWVADTPSWLQDVDIFISNSYWEGQQVALLEAMACGCYCLSHFWDGSEEVLPSEYIYATENELQKKIIDYSNLNDHEKEHHRNLMRAIACEKFDIEQAKSRMREIIEDVGTGATR
jgi:glycosyltransferase involved in cell wall biosynthesis